MTFFTLFQWGLNLSYLIKYHDLSYSREYNILILSIPVPFGNYMLPLTVGCPTLLCHCRIPLLVPCALACSVPRKHSFVVASLVNWYSLQSRANPDAVRCSASLPMYIFLSQKCPIGLPGTHSQVMFLGFYIINPISPMSLLALTSVLWHHSPAISMAFTVNHNFRALGSHPHSTLRLCSVNLARILTLRHRSLLHLQWVLPYLNL